MNYVIAIMLGVALSRGRVPAEPRDVSVAVSVTTHDGKPIAGLGLQALDLANSPCVETDATGNAMLNIHLDNPATSSIRVGLSLCIGADGKTGSDAYKACLVNFGTQDAYEVELPRTKSSVSLSIVALEAIKIRAKSKVTA